MAPAIKESAEKDRTDLNKVSQPSQNIKFSSRGRKITVPKKNLPTSPDEMLPKTKQKTGGLNE